MGLLPSVGSFTFNFLENNSLLPLLHTTWSLINDQLKSDCAVFVASVLSRGINKCVKLLNSEGKKVMK